MKLALLVACSAPTPGAAEAAEPIEPELLNDPLAASVAASQAAYAAETRAAGEAEAAARKEREQQFSEARRAYQLWELAEKARIASIPIPPVPEDRPGVEVLEFRSGAPEGWMAEPRWEPWPGPRWSLVNVSDTPQWVLPELDGSNDAWRIPKVTYAWRDAEGQPVEPPNAGRCGNLNGLKVEDFRLLAPGDALVLPGAWGPHGVPDGAVEVQVTYDTRWEGGGRPLGDLATGAEPTLARLPEGLWVSDQVEL